MAHRFGDGRDWFFEKRFGLFVHWGLYAIPAWHEQVQWRRNIPAGEYQKLIHQFNPVRFDPDQWLDLAQETGMEYVCFTTKHVDGFCLWNTAQTDYNIMNTPYRKDTLRMLADACHRRKIPLCLYYSIPDLHHPNYPHEGRSYELEAPRPGDEPDRDKYLAFIREQVRELCTQYGEIHGFWWDANMMEHSDPSFNEMIRSLQPKAAINPRGFAPGDYQIFERDWKPRVADIIVFDQPTEACQSLGRESWGYRENEDYYADLYLMRSLDRSLAKGGNYLLNVGPKADGAIADEDTRILRTIGKWYNRVRESFDDADPVSPMTDNRDVLLTRKGNTLYVHLYKEPACTAVRLEPIEALPRRATLLNTGDALDARVEMLPQFHKQKKAYLRIRNLPVNDILDQVMVIKLEFEELPPLAPGQVKAPTNGNNP